MGATVRTERDRALVLAEAELLAATAVPPAAALAPATARKDGREAVLRVVSFKNHQEELRIAWAEVYVPDDLDSHGEFMRAPAIRKMAHGFIARLIRKGDLGIDVDHDNRSGRAAVVDSFFNDRDVVASPHFAPDAWVLGVHFLDEDLWQAVKSGEKAGLSFEAAVRKKVVEIEVARPSRLTVTTTAQEGHAHAAHLALNADGNVTSGETSVVNGHKHDIGENIRTDVAEGHRHFFTVGRPVRDAA